MKIVIIEDEALTAEDLQVTIRKVAPECRVEVVLRSVQEAEDYFRKNALPDLLFCDIQLGDGSIFDLLNKVKLDAPIIFCTAYNEHTLQAFKLNGIDYILKPFSSEDVLRALNKYERLKSSFQNQFDYTHIQLPQQQNLLIHYRNTIVPVPYSEIGMIYISNQVTYLQTLGNKNYLLNKTLEELEQLLDRQFFRVNRTAIVNKQLVREVSKQLTRKLLIQLDPAFKTDTKLTVSKSKATAFLKWLKEG
jgi:DNA-binding LytR/AlgR family response regulator